MLLKAEVDLVGCPEWAIVFWVQDTGVWIVGLYNFPEGSITTNDIMANNSSKESIFLTISYDDAVFDPTLVIFVSVPLAARQYFTGIM